MISLSHWHGLLTRGKHSWACCAQQPGTHARACTLQAQLKIAQDKLAEVLAAVQKLKDNYEASTAKKKDLEDELSDLELKLERAEKLVTGLAGEKVRWEASISDLDSRVTRLPGDVVVAAAFMSYAGAILPLPSEHTAPVCVASCCGCGALVCGMLAHAAAPAAGVLQLHSGLSSSGMQSSVRCLITRFSSMPLSCCSFVYLSDCHMSCNATACRSSSGRANPWSKQASGHAFMAHATRLGHIRPGSSR